MQQLQLNRREATLFGCDYLKTRGIESYQTDSAVLLAHSSGLDKIHIITDSEKIVSSEDFERFTALLKKRAENAPLAYLTGEREFYSLLFKVEKHVLIPRPDTEILVEAVLNKIPKNERDCEILEIGTGSGCISVAIAKNCENAIITATDISLDALEIARKNAEINSVIDRVKFILSDLYKEINEEKFDIIVSNPPYIPSGEIDELDEDIRLYEPKNALDGGLDGLDFYRKLIAEGKQLLKLSGIFFFEIGYNQARSVSKILEENEFENVTVMKDYAGHDRVITANKRELHRRKECSTN